MLEKLKKLIGKQCHSKIYYRRASGIEETEKKYRYKKIVTERKGTPKKVSLNFF